MDFDVQIEFDGVVVLLKSLEVCMSIARLKLCSVNLLVYAPLYITSHTKQYASAMHCLLT